MASRSILVPRQLYSKKPVDIKNSTLIHDNYLDIIKRSLEGDSIDDRISKALFEWSKYEANHEVILFDNIEMK